MIDVIEGRHNDSVAITHIAHLGLHIHGHKEQAPLFMTSLSHYQQVLVIPCMQLPHGAIQFLYNLTLYDSSSYTAHWAMAILKVGESEGISIPLPVRPTPSLPVTMISAVTMKLLSRKKGVQVDSFTLYEIHQVVEASTTADQWKKQIPLEYHELLDLFEEKLA